MRGESGLCDTACSSLQYVPDFLAGSSGVGHAGHLYKLLAKRLLCYQDQERWGFKLGEDLLCVIHRV